MAPVPPLGPEQLQRRCDPDRFSFDTTADLTDEAEPVGQPRAVAAVRFGVDMDDTGFNVFALGPEGTGKHFFVERFVRDRAARREAPDDLCYLNNFDEPNAPIAVQLPPGTGTELRRDMAQLVDEVSAALPAAFEAEEYQTRLHAIEEEFKQRSARRIEEVQERAKERGIAVLQTPVGMVFAPLREGEVLDREGFGRLAEDEQQRLQAEIERLQQDLQKVMREVPRWERERQAKVRELNRETSEYALGHLIDDLRTKYADYPLVVAYLDSVRRDFIERARSLLKAHELQEADPFGSVTARALGETPFMRRYQVNVLVDRRGASGAPVVYEDHPTHTNLFGRIEHTSQMGTLLTDFTLLRPGALHRANGGYLVLDALKVLQQPFAWEALKRALKSRQIRLETPAQAYGLISTVSLEPEPVPLDIKVVLLGDRLVYYLLSAYDPEFLELFKVAADFDDDFDRTSETEERYARLIATLVRHHELRAFDRGAVARVVERSARMAGDAEKLSAHTGPLADLLREASYWAGTEGHEVVTAADVERAVDAHTFRSDRLRARIQDQILRDTVYIDTSGAKVGQANGLSVVQLGTFAFGRPSRITARVRLGKGEVVDIEREVELGGPVHTKGVLILASFLAARFATEQPLSLAASLVFEQSYGGVEGDSASAAELYALLSAIAEVPIRQALATTGSVNQHGEVQPVGGVNEKIEGFFDTCAARGLTGDQGVLIPASNVKHLTLRDDVIGAVSERRFHVYAVRSIDEGAELMMGIPMGEPDDDGVYPEGSLGRRIQRRLTTFAERWQAFAKRGSGGIGDGGP